MNKLASENEFSRQDNDLLKDRTGQLLVSENEYLRKENESLRNRLGQVVAETKNLHRRYDDVMYKCANYEMHLRAEKERNSVLKKELERVQNVNIKLTAELKRFDELSEALLVSERENKKLRKQLNIRKGTEDPYGINTPSSRKVFKKNSSEEQRKKQGGAIVGHKGHGRKYLTSAEADESRENTHIPKVDCCECPQLQQVDVAEHSFIDFTPMELKIVSSKNPVLKCQNCGRQITSPTPDALPRAQYSNCAIAMMALEIYLNQMTIGMVAKRHGVKKAALIGMMHSTAKHFESVYKHLMDEVTGCEFLHGDETTWSVNGKRGYVWCFVNDDFRIYMFRDSRSSNVPKEIFGDEEHRIILVTDRYCGYNPLRVLRQYCYVHLVRDLKKIELEFFDDIEVRKFCRDMMKLLKQAIKLNRKPPPHYRKKALEVKIKIMEMCRAEANHPAVQGYQNIFREHEDCMFHWVENPNIPCENNFAERNIRSVVIARKISFGCQSYKGMKTREIMTSVLNTVKCRGHNAEKYVESVLNAICLDPKTDPVKFFPPVKANSPPDKIKAPSAA